MKYGARHAAFAPSHAVQFSLRLRIACRVWLTLLEKQLPYDTVLVSPLLTCNMHSRQNVATCHTLCLRSFESATEHFRSTLVPICKLEQIDLDNRPEEFTELYRSISGDSHPGKVPILIGATALCVSITTIAGRVLFGSNKLCECAFFTQA